MKHVFLTILRDRSTEREHYRKAADQLASIMAAESGQFLLKLKKSVETPVGRAQGEYFSQEPALVSILRSGLVLLPAFLNLYPKASVGLIGIRRDEKTAEARLYYSNLPRLHRETPIFLLDPMIATGGSAALAVKLLKEAGAEEKQIVLFSILAAPDGLAHIERACPSIRIHAVHVDQKLDPKKWIVPGLGDFGDRYFGT